MMNYLLSIREFKRQWKIYINNIVKNVKNIESKMNVQKRCFGLSLKYARKWSREKFPNTCFAFGKEIGR
jgi:intergrase/recombinase